MSKALLYRVRITCQQKFNAGIFRFNMFGVDFTITLAHDNQYMVCVPGNVEIFRIIKNGNTCAVLEV